MLLLLVPGVLMGATPAGGGGGSPTPMTLPLLGVGT
jgi:hypothetical protein